ncbi:MAG: 4-hydroxy-tetrahydrodipicolinate reductase [Phycisphaeraceae bacterium]
MIEIGINGAGGRMGRRLVALASEDDALRVVAALERPGHELEGQDAGVVAGVSPLAVPLASQIRRKPKVMIDFTVPEAFRTVLRTCREQKIGLVVGTTGLTDDDHQAIDAAAAEIAVLQAPNMSLGVNLLFALAGQAAARLGDDYDIEIVEAHHRFKLDAPSGTAMGLAESICAATGKSVDTDLVHGRHGEQPRQRGEIGMHALRVGDEVGRHSVHFGTLGEEITLAHKASTRDVFARGALRAAAWLADKPAGRYHMKDVLGL